MRNVVQIIRGREMRDPWLTAVALAHGHHVGDGERACSRPRLSRTGKNARCVRRYPSAAKATVFKDSNNGARHPDIRIQPVARDVGGRCMQARGGGQSVFPARSECDEAGDGGADDAEAKRAAMRSLCCHCCADRICRVADVSNDVARTKRSISALLWTIADMGFATRPRLDRDSTATRSWPDRGVVVEPPRAVCTAGRTR